MTAKELLLGEVAAMSEPEADGWLRLIRSEREPVLEAFRSAPADDEPWTEQDEAAAAEGHADLATGRTVSHEEMLRRYG